jgi:hypothetical protein
VVAVLTLTPADVKWRPKSITTDVFHPPTLDITIK